MLVLYSRAIDEAKGALSSGTQAGKVRKIKQLFDALQQDVLSISEDAFVQGVEIGQRSAEDQVDLFGIEPPDASGYEGLYLIANDVMMRQVDRQKASVLALMAAQAEEELIYGNDERAGVLRAGDVIAAGVFWTLWMLNDSWSWMVERSSHGKMEPWRKVAVAAIDERTTDCCLRVNGQVVGLRDKFKLTGTPRYADEMDGPPFHDWCRTARSVYQSSFDDGLIEAMQREAHNELQARATSGRHQIIHPAHATSHRS